MATRPDAPRPVATGLDSARRAPTDSDTIDAVNGLVVMMDEKDVPSIDLF